MWVEVREAVFKRDNYECQYLKYLRDNNMVLDYSKAQSLVGGNDECDPAHVYSRATHPSLTNEVSNVISLSRVFHSRIDTYRSLLTNKPITKEERMSIFFSMMSEEQKEELKKVKEGL